MSTPSLKISIVTPSFNQAAFLEETIDSVLSQRDPNLEYVIIDGGSTDGSVDIIRRHAGQLAYWVSEPDKGQYDAINRGFAKVTGDVMAWINSDDKYTPWCFSIVRGNESAPKGTHGATPRNRGCGYESGRRRGVLHPAVGLTFDQG